MREQSEDQEIIMIVDDMLINLKALIVYLRECGFKVLVAQDGEDAISQIQQCVPDIILLDVLMPGIDGFETCRRLKAHPFTNKLPIIFMTALTDTIDKVRGFEVGGVDYITKPVQHEEVLARIQTHLMIRRLQKQLHEQNELLRHQNVELQRLNTALEEKNTQLHGLNASKDKFFSIISHDLRSPFSSLRGLIQFTAENIADTSQEKLENTLELLGNSTDNIYALIENLLTWSRIQRGIIDYHPQHFDLNKLMDQNIQLIHPHAERKHITIQNDIQDNISGYADIDMIDAVVRNLLSNALKFTPQNGVVRVFTNKNEKYIELSIEDTGIGIPEEHQKKLFRIDERYKRLGTEREKGTGLGLILCKEFVEKNGGRIWFQSQPDAGSTFTFTLPRVP